MNKNILTGWLIVIGILTGLLIYNITSSVISHKPVVTLKSKVIAKSSVPPIKHSITKPNLVVQKAEQKPPTKQAIIILSELGQDSNLDTLAYGCFEYNVTLACYDKLQLENAVIQPENLLLILPLEPLGFPHNDAGPGTVMTGLSDAAFKEIMQQRTTHLKNLNASGFAASHGSRFMRSPTDYQRLMIYLNEQKINYIELNLNRDSLLFSYQHQIPKPLQSDICINMLQTDEDLRTELKFLKQILAQSSNIIVTIPFNNLSKAKIIIEWLKELRDADINIITLTQYHRKFSHD